MKTFFIAFFLNFLPLQVFVQEIEGNSRNDHEKAIKAVNEGEILTLDQILQKINRNFDGRVVSINLKDNIPETVTLISESGINNASDLKILSEAGINGFLIGELFMKQISPGKALKELISESV